MNYPSVTEVLALYQDFSKIPPGLLEAGADRGTAVHKLCAAYAQGIWIPSPSQDLAGYYQSFRSWFDKYVQEVIFVEQRLVSERWHFTGQPDLLVILKGDDYPTLIDLKTPAAKNEIWQAQLSAYLHLCQVYVPKRCGCLMLDKEGKPARFIEYNDCRDYFNAFLNALYAFRFFLKKGA